MADYLIGVDGGGSGTRALVQRRGGTVLGQGEARPSALGQGIAQAWRNVEAAVHAAFAQAGLAVPAWRHCALAAGLSGAGHPPLRSRFLAADPGFARMAVDTDSLAMLLGAHDGQPGAVVIAGTGSVAEALHADGARATVGGWGFPVADEGSGAWLGLQAMRHAQAALDGRANAGALARRVWAQCGDDRERLQAWSDTARQFAFAQLAPLVFDTESADPAAALLLQRATAALEDLVLAIDPGGRLPLAAGGSVALLLVPRMRPALRHRFVPARAGAAAGALLLARRLERRALEEAA